jgi:hypothetical protein
MSLKLTVVRGGGLAGLTRQTELASEALPAGEAAKLRELVEDAEWAGEAVPREMPGHPDELSYEVSVEDHGRTTTLRFNEQTLPEALRSLIAWMDSRPERRQSIVPR